MTMLAYGWIMSVEVNRERSRMLNHLLAGIVALGSLVLFLSGFFFPEVQRKPDLVWSGVALLYALLLFAEGDRTSGGALLGHIASVALILWFGWQTLQQRRLFAAPEAQTAIPGSLDALMPFLKEGWGRILVTYGEVSAWVQDRLGKEDEGMPEMKVPLAPLQKVDDETWENSDTPASPAMESPNVETSESFRSEVLVEKEETEAISAHQESAPATPEVLAQTPSVMATLNDPASSPDKEASATPTATPPYSPPEAQVEASIHPEAFTEPEAPTATVTEPSVEPEALTQPEAALDQELPITSMAAEHSTAETIEVSHDNQVSEIVSDTPIKKLEQDLTNKDNETVRVVDDGSWPPEDPIP
jgi:Ycf66 protein N-terminus